MLGAVVSAQCKGDSLQHEPQLGHFSCKFAFVYKEPTDRKLNSPQLLFLCRGGNICEVADSY